MNTGRTTETIVESWLVDDFAGQPDTETMLRNVRAGVAGTSQRHHRWWPFGRTTRTTGPASGGAPPRGFTMFSAIKSAAAIVVVAVFGGLLLAGILMTRQADEVVPASVAGPPSPIATEALLSGMVTEEIEPGIVRVIHDGVRDIAVPSGMWGAADLTIDQDGHVWLHGERLAYRLGQPPVPVSAIDGSVAGITSDGTVWATTPESTIASFDGEAWTARATVDETVWVVGIATTPDGTAWATTVDSSQCPANTSAPTCRRTLLVRIDASGTSTGLGWEGAGPGQLQWHAPVVSPDGDVWLVQTTDASREGCSVGAFHRYDGTAWHRVDVPEGLATGGAGESFEVGSDGVLWAATGRSASGSNCMGPNRGLARLDESGWSLFTQDDGIGPWGGEGAYGLSDHLLVAPDGGVWVAGAGWDACHGVARFDGVTWTPYLEGYCVDGLEVTPEGTVLALAAADGEGPLALYAITSDADGASA